MQCAHAEIIPSVSVYRISLMLRQRVSLFDGSVGRIFHGLALLTALAALFLFLIGMYEVKEAIKHLNY